MVTAHDIGYMTEDQSLETLAKFSDYHSSFRCGYRFDIVLRDKWERVSLLQSGNF